MKQIASMVLSVNSAAMAKSMPEVREFILNREMRIAFPYRVYLFHVPNVPSAATITGFHGRADVLGTAKDHEFMGGEISGFPIGIVYAHTIGSEIALQGLLDITSWSLLDHRKARDPQTITLRTLVTATDTFKGMHGGRGGLPQVMFTDGH
jgi:hypothetical protein